MDATLWPDKKTASTQSASAATPIALAIILNPTEDTPTFYANFAEASLGQHEIALSFARTPTKLSLERLEEIKSGKLKLEPLAQILIAPTLIPGIIKALQTTRESYEKLFGSIREETPNAQ